MNKFCALTGEVTDLKASHIIPKFFYADLKKKVHIPADTRSAFPVISVQSPVSIQCCWQS